MCKLQKLFDKTNICALRDVKSCEKHLRSTYDYRQDTNDKIRAMKSHGKKAAYRHI